MALPPYLRLTDVSKAYHDKVLFQEISFSIHPGDKIALVASNGSGKTTLIRAIAGSEPADAGEIYQASGIRVGYVFQQPQLDPDLTVKEAIMQADLPAMKALRAYEKAQLSQDTAALTAALDAVEKHHGWDVQQNMQRMMSQLQLDQLTQPIKHLSGGQQRRIDLARALLEAPDLLILDEPTNHLDLDMIEWLEQYLAQGNQTLFMVTHDRYFLESVCSQIFELDRGQLHTYVGNYSDYLTARAQRALEAAKQRESALNLYRKELVWIRKQPRARGTKSKARVEAFDHLIDELQASRPDTQHLEMEVNMQRLGGKILEIEGLSKQLGGRCLFQGVHHTFNKGDRIGIIGRNGTGKTTFLNLLTGFDTADTGTVTWGETVKWAYYRQQGMTLKDDQRILDVVKDVAEYLPLKKGKTLSAAQLLERFLFPPESHFKYVSLLSGGEKRRLYLLTLLMTNPNFLILDEPTNDLDMQTIQVLEDFLEAFKGCLLVVSHDRYFMDKLVDHLFVFENEQVRYFPQSYSVYWEQQQAEQRQKATVNTVSSEAKTPRKKDKVQKLSWKEERELESLEQELETLQARLQELEAELADTRHLEAGGLQRLSQAYGDCQTALETAELRWLELEEKKEALTAF